DPIGVCAVELGDFLGGVRRTRRRQQAGDEHEPDHEDGGGKDSRPDGRLLHPAIRHGRGPGTGPDCAWSALNVPSRGFAARTVARTWTHTRPIAADARPANNFGPLLHWALSPIDAGHSTEPAIIP